MKTFIKPGSVILTASKLVIFINLLLASLSANAQTSTPVTFSYNGTNGSDGSVQTYTVPANIHSLIVVAYGAAGGGNSSGLGGKVEARLTVTPGELLNIFVGGTPPNDGAGYNGGGKGFVYKTSFFGGGGGGASDVRVNGSDLGNRIIVAGGGGGAAVSKAVTPAGPGGGLTGGSANGASGGKGGTQSAGGQGGVDGPGKTGQKGVLGIGGDGFISSTIGYITGAGGGGYYGGGSGGEEFTKGAGVTGAGGGGGGSSYTDATVVTQVTHTQGVQSGNGQVIIIPVPDITISASVSNLTCYEPKSKISVTGGSAYKWSTGAVSDNILVSDAGNYSVEVTIADGYSVTLNQTITADQTQPVVSLISSGTIDCDNLAVTLTATSIPGATYTFGFGATPISGNTASVSKAGTYSVSVTGQNGCTASATVDVTENFPAVGNIIYVKQGAAGSGASWDCAIGDLQAAINKAVAGNKIWVAGGTYVPNRKMADPNTITPNNTENTFLLKEGVAVYGGFQGSETQLEQRNWNTNETILSGRFENGNVYHVVLAVGNQAQSLSSNSILDGFTITGGNAINIASTDVNGQTISNVNGGGIYNFLSSATFSNLKVTTNNAKNLGGGIFNWSASSTFTNLVATGNSAQSGGAVANYLGNPIFFNARLSGNSATYGGGFYLLNSTSLIAGGLISGNTASYGGGFYNGSASLVLANTTIGSNTGYAIYNLSGVTLQIQNSILFGSDNGIFAGTVNYSNSLVQGVAGGTNGNLDGDIDPMFVSLPAPGLTTAGNFTLQGCSPLINSGKNSLVSDLMLDLSGNNRIFGNSVDMGGYEYQSAIQVAADRLVANGSSNSITTEAGKTYRITAQGEECKSMIVLKSNGASPVSGFVAVNTWVDESVQTYNGSPYVQRHYDISPASDAGMATASVTLYFTKAEFSAFNDSNSQDKIPSDADDATGKSHLRIYQYHGMATDGNDPAAYDGSLVVIDPADENIVWNTALERWEVTFDVVGFSGFFVGSQSSPLPVKLVSFEGKPNDSQAVDLKWLVAEQSGILEYVVEYSTNGRNFAEVGRVEASQSLTDTYAFEVAHPFGGNKAYYRLHILENNGSSYSRIISVNLPETAKPVVYPMPARDFVWIKGTRLSGNEIRLINIQGRVIQTIAMTSDEKQVDISNLVPGVYFLQLPFGGAQKIVKQ